MGKIYYAIILLGSGTKKWQQKSIKIDQLNFDSQNEF